MATIFDVAVYILHKQGVMTAMKLQKLCFYAQSWHTTWTDHPLFEQSFEAWANGPVCPALYRAHKGKFYVSEQDFSGNPAMLSSDEKESIDIVLKRYAPYTAFQLSSFTHRERPWKEARGNTPDGEKCDTVISLESMVEYYGGLIDNVEKE